MFFGGEFRKRRAGKMKNCLVIMHAREILPCMDALNRLAIPKAWFRGFTELELEAVMPEWIAGAPFDNFILISDDTIPTQKALDAVEAGLERHEVFTGWCNISPARHDSTIHIGRLSIPGAHLWASIKSVGEKEGDFETPFACFALTGARKEIWRRFPFRTVVLRTQGDGGGLEKQGWGSDFAFSLRLQEAGVPIFTSAKAFVYHLASRENFIVGIAPAAIITEGVPIA